MQQKDLTARELATFLNVPVDTVKRWARKFLPPDPTAGRQAGRARIFSLDDCLSLYLARYLVRNEGFNISDSCQILEDLKPWLSSTCLFPSKLDPKGLKDRFYELFIQKKRGEDFFRYDLKKIMSKSGFEENGKEKFIEVYVLEGISGLKRIDGVENTKVVRISMLIVFFAELLHWHKGK